MKRPGAPLSLLSEKEEAIFWSLRIHGGSNAQLDSQVDASPQSASGESPAIIRQFSTQTWGRDGSNAKTPKASQGALPPGTRPFSSGVRTADTQRPSTRIGCPPARRTVEAKQSVGVSSPPLRRGWTIKSAMKIGRLAVELAVLIVGICSLGFIAMSPRTSDGNPHLKPPESTASFSLVILTLLPSFLGFVAFVSSIYVSQVVLDLYFGCPFAEACGKVWQAGRGLKVFTSAINAWAARKKRSRQFGKGQSPTRSHSLNLVCADVAIPIEPADSWEKVDKSSISNSKSNPDNEPSGKTPGADEQGVRVSSLPLPRCEVVARRNLGTGESELSDSSGKPPVSSGARFSATPQGAASGVSSDPVVDRRRGVCGWFDLALRRCGAKLKRCFRAIELVAHQDSYRYGTLVWAGFWAGTWSLSTVSWRRDQYNQKWDFALVDGWWLGLNEFFLAAFSTNFLIRLIGSSHLRSFVYSAATAIDVITLPPFVCLLVLLRGPGVPGAPNVMYDDPYGRMSIFASASPFSASEIAMLLPSLRWLDVFCRVLNIRGRARAVKTNHSTKLLVWGLFVELLLFIFSFAACMFLVSRNSDAGMINLAI
eukprot:GHVT01105162.1.p1 GENE.GHVT01105162.1~~GHVT01105162.1.p1  ORF type:complete len:648 (+),score=70.44 GHVT01105162.1:162-1946(+)